MVSTINGLRIKSYLLPLIAIICLMFFPSCARKLSFNSSTVVPSASGKVKVKKDKNGNHSIEVNVRNLASPQNLQPPRSLYVVWVQTQQNGTKNIGQLNSSKSLFSGSRKASLKTVSSFNPARFFITAEDNAAVEYPGMQVVLRTDFFR